ncbi:MAG: T9SS type A sorting domain-containing protein [Rubricoccaceae bacterium]|nr:T9SS type A sorting domain-containing protein [Rubricoccaceae bacterium]
MRSALLAAAVLLALPVSPVRANAAALLPPTGPYDSVAVPFAPAVPGAAGADAAHYLRADGRRLGSLLAALPGPGYDPEAVLDAVAGGVPAHARPVILQGHPLDLLTLTRPGEPPVYAVGFGIRLGGPRPVVDAADGDLHVVAWAPSPEAATSLADAALDHLAVDPSAAAAQDAPPLAELAVAPNPSTTDAVLRVTLSDPAEVQVEVYDARGRCVVRRSAGWLEAGLHALPLDTAALPRGVYAVRLTAGEATATRRLTRR